MGLQSDIERELGKISKSVESAALVHAASIRACAPTEAQVKMLVKLDGSTYGSIGGGELEVAVVREALSAITNGKSKRVRIGVSPQEEKIRGMEPGGKLKYFIEPVNLIPHLYIFGAGELSVCISRCAGLLGYRVTVVDISSEYASPERFPRIEIVTAADFAQALSQLTPNPRSYIIIATRNHEYEELVLELSLRTGVNYIGMAACSEQKKNRYLAHMEQKGFSHERMKCVHAPIGLEIHAQTIEEIALSIIAEIVGIIRSEI